MKHLYNFCVVLALFALASCSPEVDDVFDESASERIRKAIEEDLRVLQSAPNGWLLEYYPSATQMYGGYTVLLSFDKDGNVKASCDIFDSGKEVQSQYDVRQSTGPTLTFDTYNEIFHFFSDPSNPFGIGSNGKGMEGDYEFLILECTAEKVVLKGKKTGVKMSMTPMPEEKPWKQYLDEAQKVADEAYLGMYEVQVNGEVKYTVVREYHRFVLTHEDGTQENLPFTYTADGIKFYEPIELGNTQMQSLTWNKTGQSYVNGDISMNGVKPAGYKMISEFPGTYAFYYDAPVTSKRVTLERLESENPFSSYLIMKGFEDYEFWLTYDAAYGRISIVAHMVTSSAALLPWALDPKTESGSFTTSAGVGLVGINGSGGVITFEDNGVWGGEVVTSMIVFDLIAEQVLLRIPYITKMVKQ